MAERCLPITRCKYTGSRRLVPAHPLTPSQRRNKASEPHLCGEKLLLVRSCNQTLPNGRGQFEEVAEPRGSFEMVTKKRLTASRGRTPRVPMQAEARLLTSKVARVAGRRRYILYFSTSSSILIGNQRKMKTPTNGSLSTPKKTNRNSTGSPADV